MSIKTGFGNLTESLQSLYVLGIPQDSNRNAILQISGKTEKRIFSISAGYAVQNGSSGTAVTGGRLIVCSDKFQGANEEIFCDRPDVPIALSSSSIFFDWLFTPNKMEYHFTFDNGLYVPEGVDVSIILTSPRTTGGAVYPETDPAIGFLSVTGIIGGSDKIFREIR